MLTPALGEQSKKYILSGHVRQGGGGGESLVPAKKIQNTCSEISVLKKLVFVHEEKKLHTFLLICLLSPRGGGGLKALANCKELNFLFTLAVFLGDKLVFTCSLLRMSVLSVTVLSNLT